MIARAKSSAPTIERQKSLASIERAPCYAKRKLSGPYNFLNLCTGRPPKSQKHWQLVVLNVHWRALAHIVFANIIRATLAPYVAIDGVLMMKGAYSSPSLPFYLGTSQVQNSSAHDRKGPNRLFLARTYSDLNTNVPYLHSGEVHADSAHGIRPLSSRKTSI